MVFLTDNGPPRYGSTPACAAGRRRCTTAEFACRAISAGPGIFRPAGRRSDRRPHRPGADVARSLRRAASGRRSFDGKSLLPLLKGIQTAGWPDRTLFFQWHRGDRPEPGRSFAAERNNTSFCATSRRSARPRCPPCSSSTWNATRSSCTTSPGSIPRSFPRCMPITRHGSRTCRRPVVSSRPGSPGKPPREPHDLDPAGLAWPAGRPGAQSAGLLGSRRREIRAVRHHDPAPSPFIFVHCAPCVRNAQRRDHTAPGQTECSFKDVGLPAGPGRLEAWIAGNQNTGGVMSVTVRRVPD